jgi:hypothetical protein
MASASVISSFSMKRLPPDAGAEQLPAATELTGRDTEAERLRTAL